MFRLLLAARRAYRLWKGLPVEQRAAFSEDIARLRELVGELGGRKATAMLDDPDADLGYGELAGEVELDGEADAARGAEPRTPSRRAAARELQGIVARLVPEMATVAQSFADDAMPRSAKIGIRAARAGLRRAARAGERGDRT